MAPILIGIVGYDPFVRSFPLGPCFLEQLRATSWADEDVEICEFNWSPVAIVQELQTRSTPPERVVLVSTTDRGRKSYTVHSLRWIPAPITPDALQERIFEAVTGVVHVDNLLAIGAHFGVWPEEVLSIEVEFPYAHVGEYILQALDQAEKSGAQLSDAEPDEQTARLIEQTLGMTRKAALKGAVGLAELLPLHAHDLTPVARFCHSHSVDARVGGGV